MSTMSASGDEPAVLTELREGVGVIALNRPDRFNALCTPIVAGIDAALDAFGAERSVRAILITAKGKRFCTGADLDEVTEARKSPEAMRAFIERGHRVFRRLEDSGWPVVAAVQGLALAGGLELVMSCDVVFAAESAQLGDQHARYGLIPGWGNSQRLPRVIGLRRALDLMYSARWLSAAEAQDWGLVNYVVPDAELEERAFAYAHKLARGNPEALAAMKRLARRALEEPLGVGLAAEAELAAQALLSDRVSEGLAAFHARREPDFG